MRTHLTPYCMCAYLAPCCNALRCDRPSARCGWRGRGGVHRARAPPPAPSTDDKPRGARSGRRARRRSRQPCQPAGVGGQAAARGAVQLVWIWWRQCELVLPEMASRLTVVAYNWWHTDAHFSNPEPDPLAPHLPGKQRYLYASDHEVRYAEYRIFQTESDPALFSSYGDWCLRTTEGL